jgi:hypothetical protein
MIMAVFDTETGRRDVEENENAAHVDVMTKDTSMVVFKENIFEE